MGHFIHDCPAGNADPADATASSTILKKMQANIIANLPVTEFLNFYLKNLVIKSSGDT